MTEDEAERWVGSHPDMHTTYGEPVWFLDPGRTRFSWLDVEIQAGRITRYAGAVRWTVLQHLALCVRLAKYQKMPVRIVGLVAVHDLHEAYVLDIPTGLKRHLPDYRRIEDLWEHHVHWSVGLGPVNADERAEVKEVDRLALRTEIWTLPGAEQRRVLNPPNCPGWAADLLRDISPLGGFQLIDIIKRAVEEAVLTPSPSSSGQGARAG